MFVTIINDCSDANAFGRQTTRVNVLFDQTANTVSVDYGDTLAGAGNLIDILDASNGQKGVVLLNLAPRHGEGKKWENGTPFAYFWYKETLVVSTVDGYALSLVKKLAVTSEIFIVDVPRVINWAIAANHLNEHIGAHIVDSQFRSYDFLPRVAKWVWDKKDVPYEIYAVENIANVPQTIWLIDNFGNCKTTLLKEDVTFEVGKEIATQFGNFTCFERLKDVPNDIPAMLIGSSGIQHQRFLEIVIQGKSAADAYNLKVGSKLF